MGVSSVEKQVGVCTAQDQLGMTQTDHLGIEEYVVGGDQIDAKEESRMRLKMDLAIVPLVCLLYRKYAKIWTERQLHCRDQRLISANRDPPRSCLLHRSFQYRYVFALNSFAGLLHLLSADCAVGV